MEIEGSPSKEDISQIALELMPDIDDLSLNENGWEEGYIGIMQIILIANYFWLTLFLKYQLFFFLFLYFFFVGNF